MENTEESELAQRRERGRMAQRAFRQRQITTIRELKGKNQELVDAIENITKTAARFSRIENPSTRDRSSLNTAIQDARRLAGLSSLGQNDNDTDLSSIQVERSYWPLSSNNHLLDPLISTSTANTSNNVSSRGSSPSMTGSAEDMTIFARDFRDRTAQNQANNQTLASRQYNSLTDSYFTSQETVPTIATTTTNATGRIGGRVSPRLTYGVWFEPDRFIRIIHPPGDIVPYLGPNINTLSGAIFWAGLGYGFTVLKEVLRMRENNTNLSLISSNGSGSGSSADQQLPLVTRLFGHSIKAAGPNADGTQILHDIIHARFTWRRQGYIPGDHPGADPEITHRLFNKVVEDLTTVPFPTPTSKISVQTADDNRNISRKGTPEMITNRGGIEELSGTTTTTTTTGTTATTVPSVNPINRETGSSSERTTEDRDLSNWLTPAEIESYVKNRLNAPIPTTSPQTSTFGGPPKPSHGNSTVNIDMNYSTFESAFQSRNHTNSRGRVNNNDTGRIRASMLKRLVRSISDKGVCFGNSPRWRIDVIARVVDEWMAEVETAERAAAMGLYGFGPGSGSGFGFVGTGDTGPTSSSSSNIPTAAAWNFGTLATTTSASIPGISSSSGASVGDSASQQQWYFPGLPGSGSYQGYGIDSTGSGYQHYQYYNQGQGNVGITTTAPAPSITAITTSSGITTTTTPATTYGEPGIGSSSSSMYYGSDSDGIGTGIPEGMVF